MKGEKTGGRKKGSLNKDTSAMRAVSGQLLKAWDREAGDEVAGQLLKAAIEKALGYPVQELTTGEEGELIKTVSRREYNFGPLTAILPYIAHKMPETLKVDSLPQDVTAKDYFIKLAEALNAIRKPS